jgi:hypothetical protein
MSNLAYLKNSFKFRQILFDMIPKYCGSNYCFGREESQMGSDYISAIKADELTEDTIKQVTVVGRNILLIKHAGQVYGVASRCPHMGCSLATGKLKETTITCPATAGVLMYEAVNTKTTKQ